MNATQLNLFNEPTQQITAQSNVLVDSHLRHSKAGHGAVQVRSYLRRVNRVSESPAKGNPTAPHNGSHTSREAAESLSSEHLQAQEALVLRAVRSAGKRGLIREQIAALTGLEVTDVCRVCNGLAGTSEGARKARRPVLLSDGPDTRRSSRGRGQKVVRAVAAVGA
jgi:hypothetical protein